ncbi:MAG: MFS transporter [Carboxydocellales bacterium]
MIRTKNTNFVILLLDAIVYAIALTFMDVNMVIPAFLDQIKAPAWQIGLASTLKQLGFLLPQFYLLTRIPRLKNQVKFIWTVYLLDRPQLLFFLALLTASPGSPYLPLIFLICFGIFCTGEGIAQLPWMNLFGRTIRPELRGKLWGITQVIGGIGSLLGGLLITKMLNQASYFPTNYLFIFGTGLIFLLSSLFFIRFAGNPASQNQSYSINFTQAIKTAWQNSNFRIMLLVQVMVSADLLALPYYIVMVKHRFPFLAPQIGTFVYLGIIGGILGGFIWGYLSDHKGNRLTIICIVLANIIVAGSFLGAQFINNNTILPVIFWPAFIMVGMVGGGWLGFVNYMLELGDDQDKLSYITLNNTCMMAVVFLPILGGILRNYYSDKLILSVVTAFMVAALFPALKLGEPRFHNLGSTPL